MHDRQFAKVAKKHSDKKHYSHSELNSKVGKTVPSENKHHVVPKCPDKNPRVIRVNSEHHKAYHMLFGNPKSYKDACTILLRDWWTDSKGNFIK